MNNELSKLIDLFEFHQKRDSSKNISKENIKDESKKEKNDLLYYDKKTQEIIDICKELTPDQSFFKDEDKFFSKQKYEKLLRSKLIESYKKHKSYERPNITVLELLDCPRKVYYERCKYEIDINKLFTYPYVYLHQQVGIIIHDVISEIYDFHEIKKKIISEKYKVKGEVDAIKENTVYEIKTIKANDFENKYREKDYYQGLIYAHILNFEYSYNIENICLLYQFKEYLDVIPKVFVINVDYSISEQLLNRSVVLHNCIKKKIVPELTSFNKEECKYCLFQEYCNKDGNNNIKINNKLKKDNDTVFLL